MILASVYGHGALQKFDDRVGEDVVTVAGNHVRRILHVDVLCVRALCQE
ncbi:MAG: hypothetical protein ACI8W7_002507, partial [Gammaproteobacteria bacterium]